ATTPLPTLHQDHPSMSLVACSHGGQRPNNSLALPSAWDPIPAYKVTELRSYIHNKTGPFQSSFIICKETFDALTEEERTAYWSKLGQAAIDSSRSPDKTNLSTNEPSPKSPYSSGTTSPSTATGAGNCSNWTPEELRALDAQASGECQRKYSHGWTVKIQSPLRNEIKK
ncbi:hypothetical protein FRB90_003906, partial [Tulasnella sp. 427]